MGGTKGYRSYRGRTSKGKIALAVLLVLIILAAVGFLWLQEYIVYDRDGSFHLELPWKTETAPRGRGSAPRGRRDYHSGAGEAEGSGCLLCFRRAARPRRAGKMPGWEPL
mgnify:CR=1 FL=1